MIDCFDITLDAPGFQDHFVALDNRINQFKGVLPSLRQAAQTRPDLVRGLLTVHILINCATMQLHAPWIQPGNPINRKSLTAARTAVTSLQKVNISQLGYIDPFMGVRLHFMLNQLKVLNNKLRYSWEPLDAVSPLLSGRCRGTRGLARRTVPLLTQLLFKSRIAPF